ncbi:hypothetical protein EYM_07015 [Ignicoccus islandicus DSM 13165]|uniref:Uncharacterized protein n=1 Tax=Ignicoccus islandicus DSM 13165 TaxID=940295 RepID=A0A0U3DYT7_9CREN|nr:hypothetical protein [Ignicoccus islandicus]ALU12746.1 hypothetical protein EYM_07015 [Ignicoccus islandicus DSM 13165]
MCPYAVPLKDSTVLCMAIQSKVDARIYPCYDDYLNCPYFQSKEEEGCDTCPLRGACGK